MHYNINMNVSIPPNDDPAKLRQPRLITFLEQKPWAGLLVILIAAAGLKLWLTAANAIPFNSDEAVVGLMARHILQGERPIFFYGQAYMGSLDAFLVAGGFAIFGQQVWVIRLIQAVLYLGVIFSTYLLGKKALGSTLTGLLAALILAIPTVNVTLYTTASLGGYGEALLIGNLELLTAFAAGARLKAGNRGEWRTAALFLLWGALAGLGLWANALAMIYTIPTGLYLLWRIYKTTGFAAGWIYILAAIPGFFAGSAPWWFFAVRNGLGTLVTELMGTAVAVEQGSYLARVFGHIFNLLLLGGTVIFGLRPPWEVNWLGLPLLPFALIFWAGVLILAVRGVSPKAERWEERRTLGGVFWTLAVGFVFTSFGVDPSGRYFIPLAVPLALAAAEAVQQINIRWLWRGVLLGVILLFNFWGTAQSAQRNPPGITTQFYNQTIIDHTYMDELIGFLKEQDETRGYTNYWVAYPLAFQSDEALIFVPRLPYHTDLRYTDRDDRYDPYGEMVQSSQKAAYITARNPALGDTLCEKFRGLGITWSEKTIGDYQVYYALSRAVSPAEMGLGVEDK